MLKAQEVRIRGLPMTVGEKAGPDFIFTYLQFLYDHYDDIHWLYIPYSAAIQEYLREVHDYKARLTERITLEIREMLRRKVYFTYTTAKCQIDKARETEERMKKFEGFGKSDEEESDKLSSSI